MDVLFFSLISRRMARIRGRITCLRWAASPGVTGRHAPSNLAQSYRFSNLSRGHADFRAVPGEAPAVNGLEREGLKVTGGHPRRMAEIAPWIQDVAAGRQAVLDCLPARRRDMAITGLHWDNSSTITFRSSRWPRIKTAIAFKHGLPYLAGRAPKMPPHIAPAEPPARITRGRCHAQAEISRGSSRQTTQRAKTCNGGNHRDKADARARRWGCAKQA